MKVVTIRLFYERVSFSDDFTCSNQFQLVSRYGGNEVVRSITKAYLNLSQRLRSSCCIPVYSITCPRKGAYHNCCRWHSWHLSTATACLFFSVVQPGKSKLSVLTWTGGPAIVLFMETVYSSIKARIIVTASI